MKNNNLFRYTKSALSLRLKEGKSLSTILPFQEGQNCEIFKAEHFESGEIIVYISDLRDAAKISPYKTNLTEEEIIDALDCCFTGDDFIELAGGDVEKAGKIFDLCSWEHPRTVMERVEMYADEEPDADQTSANASTYKAWQAWNIFRKMLCRQIDASDEGSLCRSTYESVLREFDALDWGWQSREDEIRYNNFLYAVSQLRKAGYTVKVCARKSAFVQHKNSDEGTGLYMCEDLRHGCVEIEGKVQNIDEWIATGCY